MPKPHIQTIGWKPVKEKRCFVQIFGWKFNEREGRLIKRQDKGLSKRSKTSSLYFRRKNTTFACRADSKQHNQLIIITQKTSYHETEPRTHSRGYRPRRRDEHRTFLQEGPR